MNTEIRINGRYKDLNPIFFGRSTAKNANSTPSHMRNFVMIHYVESGSGFFTRDGITHKVSAGDCFVSLNIKHHSYGPTPGDLWTIYYIGFDGVLSADFAKLPAVFPCDGKRFYEFAKVEDYCGNKASYIASLLFEWHSEICGEDKSPSNGLVERVKQYVEQNYMQDIRVEGIAKMMKLSRSYLVRCFKKATGQTVQQYIISVRLKEARRCIEDGMSIKEATFACGFKDHPNFSRLYKRFYGKNAKIYKKEIQQAKADKNKQNI